jgi:hypothetical protein
MTGTTTNGAAIEHRIGPNGRFALRMPAGVVSITAVDGDVARVRDLTDRSLADRFQIEATDDSLELVVRSRIGVTFAIGNFEIGSGGGSAELAVELPRGARVAIDTASADVSVTGIAGPGRYRTASGDLILQDVAGNLDVQGVSGDVRVDAKAPIELVGRTISGDAIIRAPRLTRLEFNTTSGDIRLDADLAGKGPFEVKTISGDVILVSRGPVQVEAQSVTGELMSDLPHKSSSSPGRRSMSVGRDGATVMFKSVSGDLRVMEPRDAAPPMPTVPSAPAAPALPAEPPMSFAAEPAEARPEASPEVEDARLEILRALERGEIDVETATDRLAAVEGPVR